MTKFIKHFIFIITIIFSMYSILFADNKNQEENNYSKIDYFNAHGTVEQLSKENLKHINLIEIISKNFGIVDYTKLKKDYWTGQIHIAKKDIIGAQKILVENKKDIVKALKTISDEYNKAAQAMIDESIENINRLEFELAGNTDEKKRKILLSAKDRIRMAHEQFDHGVAAFEDSRFASSIEHYRNAKSFTIQIMYDIAEPGEKIIIEKKYKKEIADNRNQIYQEQKS